MKKALILINKISEHPTEDELDVLIQAENVEKSLIELSYQCQREFFDLDLRNITSVLKNNPPDLVFNLVETVDRKGELIHIPPSLLESFNVPFTGSGSYALMLTTNKIRTKIFFRQMVCRPLNGSLIIITGNLTSIKNILLNLPGKMVQPG